MRLSVDSPKTKLLAEQAQGDGAGQSVLIITDNVDENLYPRVAQPAERVGGRAALRGPVSLIHFKQAIVLTEAGDRQDRGDAGHERTSESDDANAGASVCGAARPVVSEKSTMVADKNEQVIFRVMPGRDQDRDQGRGRAAVQGAGRSVQILNQKGKEKRFGRFIGRRGNVRKAYVCLKPGQEINFAQERSK